MRFHRGESLAETLASMLIITLGMIMLAGAAVSAARTNDNAESETTLTVPLAESSTSQEERSVSIEDGVNSPTTVTVNVYTITPEGGGRDENKLYYYVPVP